MKNKASVLLIIMFSVIIVAFLFIRQKDSQKITSVGSSVPDVELVGIDAKKINLSDLRGFVVFINFWATWCESCVDEMPSIENLYNLFSENSNFKLMTVIYRDSGNNAFKYMKENGYSFPVYLNPDGTAAKKFGITGIPESFIIDKNGILREKVIGPAEWDSPHFIEIFKNLLNEPV
ncbi:MAG: TlpA family protein disulfide reductase [Nitrospirae bacterium]|nr:TlpA family protein disulfide reductase [Nitrospirota bacterium]